MLNLAVLVSGSGTTLQNLLDRISAGTLSARVGVAIGSREGLAALERAETANVPHAVVDPRRFSDVTSFSEAVFEQIDNAGVDLVCLAGWLSLLKIPWRYDSRVMNVHPALLPTFGGKGMYGRRVHEAVIAYGCKVSGCTVHFVDDEYDHGPIILQRACEVRDDDTPELLAGRVSELERDAYPAAIDLFSTGRLVVSGRRVLIRA